MARRPGSALSDAPPASEPARRRGLIGGGWIAWPVAVCWCAALVTTLLIGRDHRPEMVPYIVALYMCAGFFAHGYAVAWRAGTLLRRTLAMMTAVALFLALAWLHADDAAAREIVRFGRLQTRNPEPGWFVAAAFDLLAAALLFVHGFVLGFGSRAARAVQATLEGEAVALDDETEEPDEARDDTSASSLDDSVATDDAPDRRPR